uniref:Uncharacterized protein n=1 Tax=Moniliophthora roreri TaxID=221103 RepID=A0A0W0F9R7_MONRR
MNSSTPLSHRIHEPLTAQEPSPTQLNEHDYSPPLPHVQHLLPCLNQELIDPAPLLLPITNNNSTPLTSLTLPMSRLTPERRSVWDDEDIDEEPEELLPVDRSRNPMPHTMERTEEVEYSCLICTERAPGHLSSDCHDRRRSQRTSNRNYSLGDPTAYDNLTDNLTWDNEVYRDGES